MSFKMQDRELLFPVGNRYPRVPDGNLYNDCQQQP